MNSGKPARSMGEALGGRGKRRHNIAQKHGGAKDCGGVKVSLHEFNSCVEVTFVLKELGPDVSRVFIDEEGDV